MRDLLFEAGDELVSGLGCLLRATPNLQVLHSSPRHQRFSWSTCSFSQGEHRRGRPPFACRDTRDGVPFFLKRRQRLRLDGVTRRSTNRRSAPELWLCNLQRDVCFFMILTSEGKGGSRRVADASSFSIHVIASERRIEAVAES